MPIRIETIIAKDIGPIKNININLKNINLFYSKNEGGKSLLVEFLIRCLFKRTNEFGHVRNTGNGKVLVSGISNKIIDFTPTSKIKLDQIFETNFKGLPSSFSRLLIVKSGEVELIKEKNNYSGINKNLIKELLSPRKTFDIIEKEISQTAKKAEIKYNIIEASRQGLFKEYYEKIENYNKIKALLEKISTEYNPVEYNELKIKEKEKEEKRQTLLKAKRYKAFKLACEIDNLKKEIENIPENLIKLLEEKILKYKEIKIKINKLEERIKARESELINLPVIANDYEQQLKAKKYLAFEIFQKIQEKEDELKNLFPDKIIKLEANIDAYNQNYPKLKELENIINNLKNKTKEIHWLEGVKNILFETNIDLQKKQKFQVTFVLYISILLGLAGIILTIMLKNITIGLILLVSGLLSSFIYNFLSLRNLQKENIEKNLIDIQKGFKERYNEEFSRDKVIEIYQQLSNYLQKLKINEERYLELDQQLKILTYEIEETFKLITNNKPDKSEWTYLLKEIKNKINSLTIEKNKLREDLARLNIDPTDYLIVNPGVEYSKEKFENLGKLLNELKVKFDENNKEKNELNQYLVEYNEIVKEIKHILKNFFEEEVEEDKFEFFITKIKNKIESLNENIKNREGELKGLGISEKEYYTEDPGIEFSHNELNQIEEDLGKLREKIKNEENVFNNLKNEMCKITGDDYSIGFNTLLNNLYYKKEEVENELINLESTLISQILIYRIISKLQSEEDEKIADIITSEDFSNLLIKFTGKYNRITIENDDLIISNDYESYNLEDISTGTKEQTLLALRIAFAKKILKNESAFLILDDAFQHSDYERRMLLINNLFKIANDGWQVIYCTMDDHIKNTFIENAETIAHDFNFIDLQKHVKST